LALAAAGERGLAIERLTAVYRTARRLGARPLARAAAEELARLGEKVERRLGRRAAGELEHAGLSRRELEVLRLVSVGRTNREIAQALFLSPRTVDMHVRNILTKLGCRSRTEATRRAVELGLLESQLSSRVLTGLQALGGVDLVLTDRCPGTAQVEATGLARWRDRLPNNDAQPPAGGVERLLNLLVRGSFGEHKA
jgi:DNA-binding CsgD family transcriptional regulator